MFNSVATKYLNSYIKYFKQLYTFNSKKDTHYYAIFMSNYRITTNFL